MLFAQLITNQNLKCLRLTVTAKKSVEGLQRLIHAKKHQPNFYLEVDLSLLDKSEEHVNNYLISSIALSPCEIRVVISSQDISHIIRNSSDFQIKRLFWQFLETIRFNNYDEFETNFENLAKSHYFPNLKKIIELTSVCQKFYPEGLHHLEVFDLFFRANQFPRTLTFLEIAVDITYFGCYYSDWRKLLVEIGNKCPQLKELRASRVCIIEEIVDKYHQDDQEDTSLFRNLKSLTIFIDFVAIKFPDVRDKAVCTRHALLKIFQIHKFTSLLKIRIVPKCNNFEIDHNCASAIINSPLANTLVAFKLGEKASITPSGQELITQLLSTVDGNRQKRNTDLGPLAKRRKFFCY